MCAMVSYVILNVQNCLLHSMLSVTHYAIRSLPLTPAFLILAVSLQVPIQ